MHDPYVTALLNKFFAGNISSDEKLVLARWLQEADESEVRLMTERAWNEFDPGETWASDRADTVLRSILRNADISESLPPAKVVSINRRRWTRTAVASSILLLFCTTAFFLFFNPGNHSGTAANAISPPADPPLPALSSAHAVITLSNGDKIVLDSAGSGVLANQRNSEIIKTSDGRVVYRYDGHGKGEEQYNTLDVPAGSQIVRLQLSDGSTVVLNAASSITYPVSFTDSTRKVEVRGEAYFEVVKDTGRKFFVVADGVVTEVLGTHFNVSAYQDDDAKKITLLEGSVAVSYGGDNVKLKPGQQVKMESLSSGRAKMKVVYDVDTDAEIAWKEGLFVFNKTDIRAVMRQISRWYNVNVQFEENLSVFISGSISRRENVIEVLKMLELTDEVHFEMSGKDVLVTR